MFILLFVVFLFSRCGYATLHDVLDKSHEDRMESFFLSETCKYLYLVRREGVWLGRDVGVAWNMGWGRGWK